LNINIATLLQQSLTYESFYAIAYMMLRAINSKTLIRWQNNTKKTTRVTRGGPKHRGGTHFPAYG